MLKFKSPIDEEVFRKEWQSSGLDLDEFLIQRRGLEIKFKGWEKSQRQKQNWRKYRWKYLKGIRRFHRSTEGKRFHRNLGRYLATRVPYSWLSRYQTEKEREREQSSINFIKVFESLELLIGMLSACVHALVEKRYYEPSLEEAVEYDLFLEELLVKVKELFEWLMDEREDVDWEFIVALVHPDEWKKLGIEIPDGVEMTGELLEKILPQLRKVREVVDDKEGVEARS